MRLYIALLAILLLGACRSNKKSNMTTSAYQTPFESNDNFTPTYHDVIDYYRTLAVANPQTMSLIATGDTDAGYPLHEVVLSSGGKTPEAARQEGKVTLFINNAIHPGEPCGVDASMMLTRDLLTQPALQALLDHAIVVIIPFYNIGGGLNRSGHSRANQVGPELHGFRGNARNLDLNRDFVKCDSRNAQTFNKIYTKWNPHIFIDNHTSNGADYQYVMTLIATQKDKLQPALRQELTTSMLPDLYRQMEAVGYPLTPYVNVSNTPDEGIYGFLDLPRYSSGYAVLHNSISFMPETHMLKPYRDRVKSTYDFMHAMLQYIDGHTPQLLSAKAEADRAVAAQQNFDLSWKLDASQSEPLEFKGYEAKYKPSEVSGLPRLYYDHDAPYTKEIPFYNTYKASSSVKAPKAYVIPVAYRAIIDRLKWNGVQVEQLDEDTTFMVERYKIKDFKTVSSAYEGHYLHYGVSVEALPLEEVTYTKGDYLVRVNQSKNRYIVETLEPEAPDSYFAWNFFEPILNQKEYFSSYVFEDTAADILRKHPELRTELEAAKAEDPKLAEDARAQLDFVYKRSPYFEDTFRRYPIGRVLR